MDIRKFFPVEVKIDNQSKQLVNTNTLNTENINNDISLSETTITSTSTLTPSLISISSTTDNEKPLIEYEEQNIELTNSQNLENKENKEKSKNHVVFTDGSTFNNGKKNMQQYGGIGIYFGRNDNRNTGKILKGSLITNNIAELTAILIAIKIIINTGGFKDTDYITIYTDSEYSINCITKWSKGWEKNGWIRKAKGKNQEVKNKELIKMIYEFYNKYNIKFIHVRSHQHEPYNKNSNQYKLWFGNNMADKLATDASKRSMENN